MVKKIEKIKSFSKSLAEKATSGKGRYVTTFIPFLGDYVSSDGMPKMRRAAVTLLGGTIRTVYLGIYPDLGIAAYVGLTAIEESHLLFKDLKMSNNEYSI